MHGINSIKCSCGTIQQLCITAFGTAANHKGYRSILFCPIKYMEVVVDGFETGHISKNNGVTSYHEATHR